MKFFLKIKKKGKSKTWKSWKYYSKFSDAWFCPISENSDLKNSTTSEILETFFFLSFFNVSVVFEISNFEFSILP